MINPRDMQVHEILTAVTKLPQDQQVTELQKYSDHTPLKYILKWNFDSSIQSVLPEGSPPFNSAEEDGPPRDSLWSGINLFPVFVKSQQSASMKMLQIEKQFIDLLEHIDSQEAEVIVLTKDKKLQTKYDISVETINTAFPDLINVPITDVETIPETPEEKAQKLIDLANRKKEQAKTLNAEARELVKEAKQLKAGE